MRSLALQLFNVFQHAYEFSFGGSCVDSFSLTSNDREIAGQQFSRKYPLISDLMNLRLLIGLKALSSQSRLVLLSLHWR